MTSEALEKGALAKPAKKKAQRRSQLYVEPQLPGWWDWIVILLTVGTLAALAVEWLYELSPATTKLLQWADNTVCAIFIGEFLLRLRMAPRRVEFVRRNWIDLLGAVPMVDALRSARLVRFVRLLRITRFFLVARRLSRRYDIPMPKGALTNLGMTTVVIWLISAFAFYRFEKDVNESINTFGDAVWWSMTTLSTVGYGDLYPETDQGRVIAVVTMVLGIGLLGSVAATTAATFIEIRDRGKRGLRTYVLRDHLLVLGWNGKGLQAIENFRNDPRHASTDILIVAECEEKPIDDPDVRYVRGAPGKMSILEKASAADAGAAIVLASDPNDPRSDHENALVVMSLRRLNPNLRVGAELVDPVNKEHLEYAGCDALINDRETVANLLVRSVQDEGTAEVVYEIIESEVGSELYRVPVRSDYAGLTWAEYAKAMLVEAISAIGVVRDGEHTLNPDPTMVLQDGDDAFVISREPPVV